MSECELAVAANVLHLKRINANVSSDDFAVLLASMPKIGQSTSVRLNIDLANYLTNKLGFPEPLELSLPQSVGTSEAIVFHVKHGGADLGVIKIFKDTNANFSRELAAQSMLSEIKFVSLKAPRPIHTASIELDGKTYPVMLMDAAKGSDVETIIRQFGNDRSAPNRALAHAAVRAVAKGLAEFHSRFRHESSLSEAAERVKQHEIRRANVMLGPNGVMSLLQQREWMSQEEYVAAAHKVEYMIEIFRQTPHSVLSAAHGDAHQANFVYDDTTDNIQMIDVQTMMWSLQETAYPTLRGIVDIGADLGRFIGALDVNGIAARVPRQEIRGLQHDFLEFYAQYSGIKRPALEENLHFYWLRFLAVNLEDFESKKYSDNQRKEFLDHFLREIGVRKKAKITKTQFVGHGDAASYAKYFAGMDTTRRQKIALIAALLPTSGTVVDLGCGPGETTADLAHLFPRLNFIGLDIDPKVVAHARATHQAANLSFIEGDITDLPFAPNSIQHFINSSNLHEVATFNDFSLAKVKDAYASQLDKLEENRLITTRDFVAPKDGEQQIYLDLPTTDGAEAGDVSLLSSAAFFRIFAKDFVSSVHRSGGVPYKELPSPLPGHQRFQLDRRTENEYILRKDYRRSEENFRRELLEEYGYLSQQGFNDYFAEQKTRVIVSKPIFNPWVMKNRIRGKFSDFSLDGKRLATLPSNFLIAIEKVRERPLKLAEISQEIAAKSRYLILEHFRNRHNGNIFDVVRRPTEVVDVLPWFKENGRVRVVHRRHYPRPIINAQGIIPINQGVTAGYISEPIPAVVSDGESPHAAATRALIQDIGITAKAIKEFSPGITYFPSAGGTAECVHGQPVEINPLEEGVRISASRSGFSDSGEIQSLDAQELLRSNQVGGMFDSRLETNTYHLLLSLQESVEPWIGAELKLRDQKIAPGFQQSHINDLLNQTKTTAFEPTQESGNFLELRVGQFAEIFADKGVGKPQQLEYVVPKNFSTNTASALPLMKVNGIVYAGLEKRELPVPQIFDGHSTIFTVPAWRLPHSVDDIAILDLYLSRQLKQQFGVEPITSTPIGGEYFVSPGTSPEMAVPYAIEIDASKIDKSALLWVSLTELVENRGHLRDGHLLVSVLRSAHALGL